MFYIIANWKMNKTQDEAIDFFTKINSLNCFKSSLCKILISPPIIHLSAVEQYIGKVGLVAQNISCKESGAYTGETSINMLSSKVSHILIGHSERRKYFHETSLQLLEKLQLCIKKKITPIFCFGEKLIHRDSNVFLSYIKDQLSETIFSFDKHEISNMILAYEPVWAIGTGKNANAAQIKEVHDFVREILIKKIGHSSALKIPILYGGSCNSNNAQTILKVDNVNGLLVGGASLDFDHFRKIIEIADDLS